MFAKTCALMSVLFTLVQMTVAFPSVASDWPDKIKIGVYLPMTGLTSSSGQKLYAGISIAHATKPTVAGGIPVELVFIDTAGDVKRSVAAVKKLIDEEDVSAIIGEADETNTRAASEITEKKKIPMVTPAVTASMLTESRKFLFRTCFSDTFQAQTIARYAIETLEARRASILIDINRDASILMADTFKNSYTEKGGSIVSIAYCASGSSDFTLQISSLMASKPNFVFLPLLYAEIIQACKKAAELSLNVPMFTIAGPEPGLLIDRGGTSVEGLMFFDHFSPDAPASERDKAYAAIFKAEKGNEPGILEILGGDAYFVILDAIERAQSANGSDIQKALARTLQFPGLSGPITLGDDGNAQKSTFLLQIKEGRLTYLKTLGPRLNESDGVQPYIPR